MIIRSAKQGDLAMTDKKDTKYVSRQPSSKLHQKRPRGEQFKNPRRQLLSGENFSPSSGVVGLESEADHTVPPPGES
jgi:hypothetical protein